MLFYAKILFDNGRKAKISAPSGMLLTPNGRMVSAALAFFALANSLHAGNGDAEFLRDLVPSAIPLSIEKEGTQVWVSPNHQGRILAVEAPFLRGANPVWIHRGALSETTLREKFNPFGGADRIWFGPEAGPFGFFFDPGVVPGTPGGWRAPAALDREALPLVRRSVESAFFKRHMELVNHAGTCFALDLEREIRILSKQEALRELPALKGFSGDLMAYESRNRVTNVGSAPWVPEKGLPSIWIIGLFEAGEKTVAMLPLSKEGQRLGLQALNRGAFAAIAEDRLRFHEGTVFFRADGAARGKIGLAPQHTNGFAGAYDPERGVLTLIQFSPLVAGVPYVNTAWDDHSDPYAGDAVNIYNGHPNQINLRGQGFFELESSSPALALAPGEHHLHVHRTFHFAGSAEDLGPVFATFLNTQPATASTVFKP
jgi:hypothetical protein